ncbi:MAG: alanine--tRNA ligase [Candidatus Pacebacteria bacterium]|nr:alanine--tRNA ligase [Candidatus Paceibacterota bacterium]
MTNSNSLRKQFLDFFEKRGHKIVRSSSLIPTDPSVLFTTAGMQQFKPYFLGEKSPYGRDVASCQKCIRTSDIESVGDATHLTFFEMLGNFSFGGYFKKEAILYAWEFLTKELSLPEDPLWITYFKGERSIPQDSESKRIWREIGVPDTKIYGFSRKENFWGPTGIEGPCGPTTEIHFDLTKKPCQKGKDCIPNCECKRFVEVWNLVFNEYYQDPQKNLKPLTQKGVDTGMGLERLLAIVNQRTDLFETDLFWPIILEIEKETGKKYQGSKTSFRIIADHIKAGAFLIAEGIYPSKEERGYIVRRLLRRSQRFARQIGLSEAGLLKLVPKIIEIYKETYPELEKKLEEIMTVMQNEFEKFAKTIERGTKEFEKLAKLSKNIIEGEKAFYLYESFGFPLELIEEMAREKGIKVDKSGFFSAQKRHKEVSRKGAQRKFGGVGIEMLEAEADKEKVTKLHTATHLLHQALREVLGEGVRQMGSDISPERLRFDFSWPSKLSEEEIRKVEEIVNQKIKEDLPVTKKKMSFEEAQKIGALAFFKEKYPERVSVYFIGDFSKEICAGPHVERTGFLGKFKIIKEESAGAGIRRIKAKLE